MCRKVENSLFAFLPFSKLLRLWILIFLSYSELIAKNSKSPQLTTQPFSVGFLAISHLFFLCLCKRWARRWEKVFWFQFLIARLTTWNFSEIKNATMWSSAVAIYVRSLKIETKNYNFLETFSRIVAMPQQFSFKCVKRGKFTLLFFVNIPRLKSAKICKSQVEMIIASWRKLKKKSLKKIRRAWTIQFHLSSSSSSSGEKLWKNSRWQQQKKARCDGEN